MAKGSVRFRLDDKELRQMLSKAKDKKVYRQLANEVLQDLKEDVASLTHVDTGLMQRSWETTPLKMRDSGYHVFGELINEAQQPWQDEPYPLYELARGGDHNALDRGIEMQESKLGDKMLEVLEGLLR